MSVILVCLLNNNLNDNVTLFNQFTQSNVNYNKSKEIMKQLICVACSIIKNDLSLVREKKFT